MSGHEQNTLKRPVVAMLCVLLIAVGAACASAPSEAEPVVEFPEEGTTSRVQ